MAGKNIAALKKTWGWFLALGILLVLFGFMVIMFPVAGTFTIEILFGVVLLIAGLAQLGLAFHARGWGGFLLTLISGLLYTLLGLLFLLYPLSGAITLTLLLGAFLLLTGLIKLGLAAKLKPNYNWNWVMFDGLITILLGILILAAWPSDSLWVVGLLFGINLVFSGLSSIVISLAVKES